MRRKNRCVRNYHLTTKGKENLKHFAVKHCKRMQLKRIWLDLHTGSIQMIQAIMTEKKYVLI